MKQVKKNSHYIPNYFAEGVYDIDFAKLKGVKLALFDLDATLVEHGSMKVDNQIVSLIKNCPLETAIATNRIAPKGDKIAHLLGIKHIFHATKRYRKPQKHYFNKILAETGYKPHQIVMIGDRLISDIYGANRAGFKTIMVRNFGIDPWYINYFGIRKLEYLALRLLAGIK